MERQVVIRKPLLISPQKTSGSTYGALQDRCLKVCVPSHCSPCLHSTGKKKGIQAQQMFVQLLTIPILDTTLVYCQEQMLSNKGSKLL